MDVGGSFKRQLKRALDPGEFANWIARGSGVACCGPDGHWGQIHFMGTSRREDPLGLPMVAGVGSPYILEVIGRRDPAKPPSTDYVGHTAMVVWQYPIRYGSAPQPDPVPFEMRSERYDCNATPAHERRELPVAELDPDSARAWLHDAFCELIPRLEALFDDLALRDWLLSIAMETMPNVRKAILLTQKIGRFDELGPLLDLDARLEQQFDERWVEMGSRHPDSFVDLPDYFDRSPIWLRHEHFAEFVDRERRRLFDGPG